MKLTCYCYADLQEFCAKPFTFKKMNEEVKNSTTLYDVIARLCLLHSKIMSKIRNHCSFNDSLTDEDLSEYISGYTAVTAYSEPSAGSYTVRTYLYLVVENAILTQNLALIKDLTKIMKFEHSHVRLSYQIGNEEITQKLIEFYDQVYNLSEFNTQDK